VEPGASLALQGKLVGNTRRNLLFTPFSEVLFEGRGTALLPELLEAMSLDLGATNTGFENNFAYTRLTLANNTYVKLVNLATNSGGTGPEAVYASEVVVPNGCTLDLNGLKLYSRVTQINGTILGGSIAQVPLGGQLYLGQTTPATIATSGDLDEFVFFGRANQTITVAVSTGAASLPVPLPPFLNYAQVSLLDSTGAVLLSNSNSVGGGPVTLLNVPLPADGNYRVQVRAGPQQSNAIGNYEITVWITTPKVATLVLGQQANGLLETPYAVDQWNFSATAGQEVRLDVLNASAPGLAFRLNGPNGFIGFSNLTSSSDPVLLPATGSYTLQASGLGTAFNIDYAFIMVPTPQTNLALGATYTGQFAGNGQSQLFTITVTNPGPLLVSLVNAGANNVAELYLKLGSPPTRSSFELQSATPNSASQQILLQHAAPGTYYVLVYGNVVATPGSFTLQASITSLFLTSVTPNLGANNGPLVLTLTGAGFNSSSEVELVAGDGTPFAANSLTADSYSQLTAGFASNTVPAGMYSVRVSQPGGFAAEQTNVVQVTPPGAAQLDTRLIMPLFLGRHAVATLYVEYANTGTVAMLAPLLKLQGTGPTPTVKPVLTLDASRVIQNFYSATLPPGVVNQVFILASGAQPGVLNPGERVQVPVYYLGLQQPWDFTQNQVELQVRFWTADDATPIDWSTRQESLRPPTLDPAIWSVIYTNLTAGLTNSGAYVRMLDDNAQFLGRLGERVLDVDNLWNFEVQQAYGFAALPVLDSALDASMPVPGVALNFTRQFSSDLRGRNSTGWFGRGWYTPWQATLSVQSNGGLVELIGQAGSARVFTLDTRSQGYFSGPGDSSRLIAIGGGIYQLRDPNGLVTQFRVDGKIDYVQDPNGNRVTAGYNASSQLVTLSHTSGASLAFTYNGAGLIQMVTDFAGRSVSYSYDPSNTFLQTATTDDGKVATYTYQTAGNLAQQNALTSVTRDGATRHFTYDTLGRLATAYFGTGQDLTTFGYDSAGGVTTTDGLGTSSLYFDYRGLIARISDALGDTYTVDFDNDLHPTQLITPTGDSQGFSFCTCGALSSFQDELAHTYTFERNSPFGELTRFTDPLGRTTAYNYDLSGNLVTTLYPDQSSEQFGNYTPSGQPQQYSNRRQQQVLYAYTAAGQVTRQSFSDGSFAAFQYDARGNILTVTNHLAAGTDEITFYTYNYAVDGDRLRRILYPDGRWVAFAYDGFGRRQQVTDSTGQTNYLSYDAAGRLFQVSDTASNVVAEYRYNAAGLLTQVNKANGTFNTYSYDPAGNLTHLTNFASNATINSRFDYTYDSRGRPSNLATLDGTWTYEYDSVSQLTSAVFASINPAIPNQDLHYVYDAVGNRTATILNGLTTSYVVNSLNQYSSVGGLAYEYDADGNLISDGVHSNSYDTLNRLLQVTGPEGVTVYEYDALGNRSATVFNGQRTEYLLDPIGMPTVLAEQDSSANVLAHYVQGSGLILRADAGGSRGYYDFDAMGSTAGISGSGGTYLNQYSYLPFGDSMAAKETVTNPFQFIGRSGVALEHSGFHFMRARYYSASLGRFLNPDPSRFASLMNNYRYAGNEPTRFADPTGLQFSPGFKPNGFGRCGQPGVQLDAITFNPCAPSPPPPPSPGPGGGGEPGGPGGGGGGGTADSFDPNELIGPSGYAQLNYLVDGGLFDYQILFQNETNATAPAQNVTITDPLSTNLNWTTFQLTELGFGDQFIPIAPNTQHFQTNVPAAFNGVTFEVQIEAGIDLTSGQVFASFMSLDPFTGLPPAVDVGFLPPEDGTGRGTGHLSYSVRPKSGLATGVRIANVASIRFDINPIITTDQIDPHDPSRGIDTNKQAIVTIDSTPPISAVNPLPAVQTNSNFVVCWSGSDIGSGIVSYDIFVSTNNGPFTAWILGGYATNTCATFNGQPSTKYGFYSVAHDGAGNVQATPAGPNTQTTTPAASLTPQITSVKIPGPGQFQIQFSGRPGLSYTVLRSVNLNSWTVAGSALETSPGQFQFLDPNASGQERYYRIRFP
jgi:RHS repeat-associated protein